MKKLCLIGALIGTSLGAISQTSLDHLLFEKCNNYRSANGLKRWAWSGKAFEAAEHHTNYQVKSGTMGHDENTRTPSPTSRLDYYGIDWVYSGENCAVVCASGYSEEYIANRIFQLWRESPTHNDVLLNPNVANVGAISCKRGNRNSHSKNELEWLFCTLTVYAESDDFTSETSSNIGYTEEMKDNYHRELAESMKNWSPDRVKAFRRIFVYGPHNNFNPISKDTLTYYYPEYKRLNHKKTRP